MNNPISLAFKSDAFPSARRITVEADAIWVDGEFIHPSREMRDFIIAWNTGRKVFPCLLAFYRAN